MDPKTLSDFLVSIQKKCLPGTWSKGVSLVRESKVKRLRTLDDEIQFQVMRSDRPVAVKVSLYVDDDDFVCDCDEKASPCSHVAACVAGLKSGQLDLEAAAKIGSAFTNQESTGNNSRSSGLYYHFSIVGQAIQLKRSIQNGSNRFEIGINSEFKTLVAFVGAQKSGRVSCPDVNTTQDDYKIDQWISHKQTNVYESADFEFIFKHLEDSETVTFDTKPCRVEPRPPKCVIAITDEKNGFRIKLECLENLTSMPSTSMPSTSEVDPLSKTLKLDSGLKALNAIADGILLWNDQESNLHLCRTNWSKGDFEYWSNGDGKWYSNEDIVDFVLQRLPKIKKLFKIDVRTSLFPEVIECDPRLILDLNPISEFEAVACVHMVYGDPALAEVSFSQNGGYSASSSIESKMVLKQRQPFKQGALKIPLRSLQKEHMLQVKCQADFFLKVDQPRRMKKTEAAVLRQKWNEVFESHEKPKRFAIQGELTPVVDFVDGKLEVSFRNADSDGKSGVSYGFDQVFKTYREGESLFPVFSGQDELFSKIPTSFLQKYGERLRKLLAIQEQKTKLPTTDQLDLNNLMSEMGFRNSPEIENIASKLGHIDKIPPERLPENFTANLRPYQIEGFHWLSFLKKIKCGALLADDMGLGKTVQAIAVLDSKSLVIVPTSVIESWVDQITKFRPDFKVCVYYGPNRQWPKDDSEYDVIITSYALLRNDSETFLKNHWSTIIVDEAQNIKNPESQLARIIHHLNGDFKIALTGTPIENRLDDLWSIFEFTNPSYLGDRSEFRQSDQVSIKKRIKPFVLRRLKADVAKDLPSKVESVLKCEVTSYERSIIDTLFASTKEEIVKLIESDGSVFSALEVLLRLRQASTDVALLGGEILSSFKDDNKDDNKVGSKADNDEGKASRSTLTQSESELASSKVHSVVSYPQSSKTKLLMEQLDQAIENGHRCLVFSQWTSYLDRIERTVNERGFQYLRLDGSTKNRGEIISHFQSNDGPPLFLISLKAGGVGLTLTKADHVYLMDPWWNPAVEEQAMDRTHRIGQENTVFVYRIVSEGTIEENILKLSTIKKNLAKAVFDFDEEGDSFVKKSDQVTITKEDLKVLFDL